MPDPVVLAGPTATLRFHDGEALLTDVERERAARLLREGDRRDYVAAHVLVRHCAAELLGLPPDKLTLLQHCDTCGPGHGRPYLAEAPDVGVSLSHTMGYVCAAAGPGKVGVDVERVPPGPMDPDLAGQALAPRELVLVRDNRALIRQWVRKEALVKRDELTLSDLPGLDLSALPLDEPGTPRRLLWQGRHLLEWSDGDVLATTVTDHPAVLSPAFTA
ncbi:4'-phosphopantetheinyl transferase superfamily protein [Streptosporangium soli]|nr:4'-phosphopantetheinyl transferase superfamily protein [Streptosporangium sp. KLBMP 9127]